MPKTPPLKTKNISSNNNPAFQKWSSPIPEARWRGFRVKHRGIEAFKNHNQFEEAQVSELEHSLEEHEREALARLIKRGVKDEMEVFLRTHGANPISDPNGTIDVPIGVAKADVVDLKNPSTPEANAAFLNGEVVHVLFQAGEASRFNRGPLYKLSFFEVAKELAAELNLEADLESIQKKAATLPAEIADFLTQGHLGPKQMFLLRAGLRRIVQDEINNGRLKLDQAEKAYETALSQQKVLFFMGRRGGLSETHNKALREIFQFYGLDPQNCVTVDQELIQGMTLNEKGAVSLMGEDWAADAAGHLCALLQAARQGDFTTYTESGRVQKPMELDALGYLSGRGGKYLSIVRINDMDRHTTEIINAKAFTYALTQFQKGYFNVIEGVANPSGQKGGTGTTFGDPDVHVLTETHENSYSTLSRVFDKAMKDYLEKNEGQHPAYNAMRQFADLQQTRIVLREFGGRIVFVPRQKRIKGAVKTYIGVDMPMGDLSLFLGHYKSRMFQLRGPGGKDLLIHDVKKKENLPIALRTILRQLEDPHIVAATKEILTQEKIPFSEKLEEPYPYGSPTPEFE